jgi:hypothetical protein
MAMKIDLPSEFRGTNEEQMRQLYSYLFRLAEKLNVVLDEIDNKPSQIVESSGSGGAAGKDGKDGKDGRDGKDGYTPVKGVDYFDGKDGYTPIKGVDYFDGEDGKDGADGAPGKDGAVGPQGPQGPAGKDGTNGKSAYESAQTGGYTGTETAFYTDLAQTSAAVTGLAALAEEFTEHKTAPIYPVSV